MNLFYQPLIPDGVLYLDEEESRHCVKVLRRRIGDTIAITDGKGAFYDAVIEDDSPKQCRFQVREKTQTQPRSFSVHAAVSPTKNADRIEWFVEKAVEIGIEKITLIHCDHTERSFIKHERLVKLAISAMKQSLKCRLPEISPLTSFSDFVKNNNASHRYIAFVDSTNPDHLKNVASGDGEHLVLIGPEGDFSPEELTLALSSGFLKVSLGSARLRTETAALAACHILNLIHD